MTSSAEPPVRRSLVSLRSLWGVRGWSATWSWAFFAQGVSSATSFVLSLLAGRALGAHGLGIVFTGFTAYVMLLALHRAVVTTPLISSSSVVGERERVLATRTALGASLAAGLACSGLMAVAGAFVGGPIHSGLLAFAPWLVPAFAQELFRSSLFRDGRGRQAALADLTWLATMVALAPLAVSIGTPWAVVGAWGLGSVAAACVGGVAMRAAPVRASLSRTWLVRAAFPFGRWLLLQEGSFAVGFYGLVVILTAILGAADLGGFRAADSVFAPFTLLAPAVMLAGLPAVSRSLARSRNDAVGLAGRITAGCMLIVVVYSSVMLVAGSTILTTVFGDDFAEYDELIFPMAAWQVALALGVGYAILLRAEQRGRAILVSGSAWLAASLCASSLLAALSGIDGAVWGLAGGAVLGSLTTVFFAVRGPRGAEAAA